MRTAWLLSVFGWWPPRCFTFVGWIESCLTLCYPNYLMQHVLYGFLYDHRRRRGPLAAPGGLGGAGHWEPRLVSQHPHLKPNAHWEHLVSGGLGSHGSDLTRIAKSSCAHLVQGSYNSSCSPLDFAPRCIEVEDVGPVSTSSPHPGASEHLLTAPPQIAT